MPPVLFSLAGAATIWAVLYVVFNRHVWRWRWISRAIKTPDVSGSYLVTGETLNGAGDTEHPWKGNLSVTQSWDRIRVQLKTEESTSYSLSAALFFDPADGYRLMYHYRNEPVAGATKLNSHRGFAEITFSDDLRTGSGEYFNGQGRFTFGRLNIARL